MPILGESLSATQGISLFLIIIGGSLVSVKRPLDRNFLRVSRYTSASLFSSFAWGLAHLEAKYVLEDLPTSIVFAMQQIGVSIILFSATGRDTWGELISVRRQQDISILMFWGEGIVPYVGIALGLLLY